MVNAAEIEKCIDDCGTDIYRFCLKLCLEKADARLEINGVKDTVSEIYIR